MRQHITKRSKSLDFWIKCTHKNSFKIETISKEFSEKKTLIKNAKMLKRRSRDFK